MLVSLHIFMRENVDFAVYETHCGGEYDCTNFLSPFVTGITTIGMDHVRALGPAIEDIAWHKAGILKSEAAAFSLKQLPQVAEVLKRRADGKGVNLHFVEINDSLPLDGSIEKPEVLRMNASLAIHLANTLLQVASSNPEMSLGKSEIYDAWKKFSWQGRFQHIVEGQCDWFLDVAHNEISLKVATSWFAQAALSSAQT
jgi:folylpolyglutamate synthase